LIGYVIYKFDKIISNRNYKLQDMENICVFGDIIENYVPPVFYGIMAVLYIWTLSDSPAEHVRGDNIDGWQNDTDVNR
jgi:hypothetical protein